jgi:hypothetical protein
MDDAFGFDSATAYTLGCLAYDVVNAHYYLASVGIYSERHPTRTGSAVFVELAPPVSDKNYDLAAQGARDSWDNEQFGFHRQYRGRLPREWAGEVDCGH